VPACLHLNRKVLCVRAVYWFFTEVLAEAQWRFCGVLGFPLPLPTERWAFSVLLCLPVLIALSLCLGLVSGTVCSCGPVGIGGYTT
jgi:hypothetical protein